MSGASYQVFEEDERGTSRQRILKGDTHPHGFRPPPLPGGAAGGEPSAVDEDAPKPVLGAIAALTLVFAACALVFAWLSHAPKELLAGIGGVAALSAAILAVGSIRARPGVR